MENLILLLIGMLMGFGIGYLQGMEFHKYEKSDEKEKRNIENSNK